MRRRVDTSAAIAPVYIVTLLLLLSFPLVSLVGTFIRIYLVSHATRAAAEPVWLPACMGAEFTGGFCMPQSTDGCRSYCLSTAAFWQVHLLRLHASIRFYNAVETLNALKTLSKHRLEKGKENERERGILSFPSGGPECFCFCCCCSLSIQRHSFEFLFPSSVMKLN